MSVAPYVFSLDEDGKAAVADLNGADEDTLIEASQGCPTSAILLIDTETGEAVCP
ncbi:MAG: ferredoxin [Candidatus Omnitrophica bacterium]|nr:ferredoxin [Candidatus Omnitrophota bacterium]